MSARPAGQRVLVTAAAQGIGAAAVRAAAGKPAFTTATTMVEDGGVIM